MLAQLIAPHFAIQTCLVLGCCLRWRVCRWLTCKRCEPVAGVVNGSAMGECASNSNLLLIVRSFRCYLLPSWLFPNLFSLCSSPQGYFLLGIRLLVLHLGLAAFAQLLPSVLCIARLFCVLLFVCSCFLLPASLKLHCDPKCCAAYHPHHLNTAKKRHASRSKDVYFMVYFVVCFMPNSTPSRMAFTNPPPPHSKPAFCPNQHIRYHTASSKGTQAPQQSVRLDETNRQTL